MSNPFITIESHLDRLENLMLAVQRSVAQPPQTTKEDELLTPTETACLLKVSKVTVWDWSKKGILAPRRIGNQVRYLKSEVLAANKPIPSK